MVDTGRMIIFTHRPGLREGLTMISIFLANQLEEWSFHLLRWIRLREGEHLRISTWDTLGFERTIKYQVKLTGK